MTVKLHHPDGQCRDESEITKRTAGAGPGAPAGSLGRFNGWAVPESDTTHLEFYFVPESNGRYEDLYHRHCCDPT
eukprot:756737-Hanusia_phi.AAC.1